MRPSAAKLRRFRCPTLTDHCRKPPIARQQQQSAPRNLTDGGARARPRRGGCGPGAGSQAAPRAERGPTAAAGAAPHPGGLCGAQDALQEAPPRFGEQHQLWQRGGAAGGQRREAASRRRRRQQRPERWVAALLSAWPRAGAGWHSRILCKLPACVSTCRAQQLGSRTSVQCPLVPPFPFCLPPRSSKSNFCPWPPPNADNDSGSKRRRPDKGAGGGDKAGGRGKTRAVGRRPQHVAAAAEARRKAGRAGGGDGQPRTHVKCFYAGLQHGAWLAAEALASRASLVAAVSRAFADDGVACSSEAATIVLVGANQQSAEFPAAAAAAGAAGSGDDKWATAAKSAVRVYVR